ncbi:hypothetical protein WA026_021129 [Henosepilachna vigintioctopunctata]|uniref:Uncharacterized protein n=1 Tax=Henosepilachna vigintioctopunctata TaxID=420089 RepID=A0AAW1UAL9_9CUCU
MRKVSGISDSYLVLSHENDPKTLGYGRKTQTRRFVEEARRERSRDAEGRPMMADRRERRYHDADVWTLQTTSTVCGSCRRCGVDAKMARPLRQGPPAFQLSSSYRFEELSESCKSCWSCCSNFLS